MGSPAGYLRHRSVRTRRGEGSSVNMLKLPTWAAASGRLVHLRQAVKTLKLPRDGVPTRGFTRGGVARTRTRTREMCEFA